MRCPYCNQDNTRVVDSRPVEETNSIRRRRLCDSCGRRFTTYENVEIIPLTVIKKNLNREQYDRNKLINGIRRYLRDNNSIRVSRSLRDIAYRAIYAKESYMKNNLKEPTIAEIADEIGIEKETIVYAMDAIQNPVSLFEPVYTEGGDTLYVMDQISDKKNKEENWVENLSLREAINKLNKRERHIIDLRFYEGKTQMEVAQEIGISQAQVSRLEKNALKTMRNYLRA